MPLQRTEAPVSAAARRCVIYCRKSSSEGLDRNYTSIDAQRDTCLRFIESHAGDGWQYTGQVFEDGGFSGGTTDRPAFQRMMRDVRNGEIDIIVIYNRDRINRNKRDFWNIEHELRQHGVEIACATQSIELKTSTGRVTTGIMMDFAELEREMDSERILGQLRAARAAGCWSAAATPYGYRKNEDSELVVDEPKAEAIRFIFERYPVIKSAKQVAKELNDRFGPKEPGTPWLTRHVYKILQNIAYKGLVAYEGIEYKGIHGSTAIEGNTLTEEQVTAVLEGNKVVATQREIDEVLCAAAAYEAIESIDLHKVKDLLKVHKLMMGGLVETAGAYRTGHVGVIDSAGNVVHMAPPAAYVPKLMKDLFKWLNESGAHPLVKSCVFHYEFEFIHPFQDGNGRTGRYWQTAILGKWRNAFYAAPIENIVWENQSGYYLAIQRSALLGNSEPFIDFMLERILQAIKVKGEELKDVGVNVGVKLSARERDLLELLRLDGTLTAARIAETYSISTRQAERLLTGLKKKGVLVRKGSDKGDHWKVVS